ncbi:asparagine synthase (glutamine-hydrolyzing) [Candidatus Omnitrophota bacterium]
MCGICGFNQNNKRIIDAMTDVLAHRGPDAVGTYVSNNFSLGHRRLSILDLSDKGNQPMFNEDKSVCVVYNGEIYNYPELKNELVAKGHIFYSTTDTEVIVHAYEEWGYDCVQHFNGMFAFAIFDIKKDELFVARDRIGIKPLYYYWDGNLLVFASEIKSIVVHPEVKKEVDNQSLYYYLGYEFVPGPLTMFKNIFKLQPGTYLLYKQKKISTHQYWELSFVEEKQKNEFVYVEKLRELIESAVKMRLLSDVPLGMFLSGGLDSSTILAFMRKHVTGTIRTFSIGYPDPSYSELEYAKFVADVFGAEHNVLMIDRVTSQDIEDAVWSLDEPMTDMSTIPYRMISARARKDVTVCLSGEGGDEIFAGYDRFKASRLHSDYFSMLPQCLRKSVIMPIVDALPETAQKKGFVNMLKRFIDGGRLPAYGGHMRWQYFTNDLIDRALYQDHIKSQIAMDGLRLVKDVATRCQSNDRLAQELFVDIRFTMTDSILMKVDKMSMAYALETRVPLLDHRVVEYAASIPSSLKLKGFTTKYIFRKALKGLLPEKIVWRGKQGYSFPSKNWLREGLKEYLRETLMESSLLKDTLNMDYVDTLIKQHMARKSNHNHVLWALLNLALWHKRFF